MKYSKFGKVIRKSIPASKPSRLTDEQIEKLKTAGALALAIIGVAGMITLSAVAPNIFTALDKIFGEKIKNRQNRRNQEERLIRTFYYLKRHKYILMKPTGTDFKVFLTRLGRKRLRKIKFDTLTVPVPKKWDRKWWQIAADIPTKKHKRAADALRLKLRTMKFYPLQRTLWFYPYDPREEVEYLVDHFNIALFVTVMEVSRLDFDDSDRMESFFKKEGII